MADADDAPFLDADIGFDHAGHGIEDERVGNDQVERLGIERQRGLPHAIADDFAAAEFHLVAVAAALRDEVALHLDEQIGIGEAHAVAHGGAKHFGVLPAG